MTSWLCKVYNDNHSEELFLGNYLQILMNVLKNFMVALRYV